MIAVKVKEVIQRTHNVKSIRLDIQNANFKAGQFLLAKLKDNPEFKRYLSISNSPTENNYLEFTKKITGSDFSKALDNLKPQDVIEIQYPLGKFSLQDNFNKIAFISGGIGITPIRSITKYAVDKKLSVDMVLLYANRSIKDIVFRDDFELMQKQFSGLRVTHVLCEPAAGFKCSVGLINAQVVKAEIPDYLERKFFLCGPPAMVDAMKKMLLDELKTHQENIITENFQGY